ncbi:hypothetical protein AX17_003751 [Amanita inopinata Kibby_2008]|nr:hypothetical protein AX17_003751 [Amanita inopinata Kibby_2008]
MEEDFLEETKGREIDLIVCTDSEAILGIGDQGVGGIGVGMWLCHENRLRASLKLVEKGWPHKRVRGEDYDRFIDKFVQLVRKHYPHSLLHFEDFGVSNAHRLLGRYRDTHAVFNDDMCVVVNGLSFFSNEHEQPLWVLLALQKQTYLIRDGPFERKRRFWLIDRYGLIKQSLGDDKIRENLRAFVRPDDEWEDVADKDGRVRRMTDTMLVAGAQRLASLSPALRDPDHGLLPDLEDAPWVNFEVGIAVAEQAVKEGSAGAPWVEDVKAGRATVRQLASEKVWVAEIQRIYIEVFCARRSISTCTFDTMAEAPVPVPIGAPQLDGMQGILPTAAPVPGVPISIPAISPPTSAPPASSVTPQVPPDSASVEPEHACETLYIQNLNEKIKIDVLKATLRGLFKSYGDVVDVVAHSNLRMRGQAFVSFASTESAKKALKDVQRFPLYSKPMQISFARVRSDAVVKKLDPEAFGEHKTARDDHKKKTRYTNPLKQKFRAKRMAAEMDGAAALPAPKRPTVQMPDEYLPPNKILFLQNLPETVTKEQLMALFSQYPNLYEVRLIPTKRDIAFVEYFDEGSAGVAKDALHNYKLDGENKIKITFARK